MVIQFSETKWGNRDLALSGDPEADAAGDQHRHVGTGAEEVGHVWGGLDDLLEVVEQEQEALVAQDRLQSLDQRRVTRLAHGERLDDGGSHQHRIADRGERNDRDTIGEVICHRGCRTQREPGLADAAGTAQGHQRHVLTKEQVAHLA
jgi:hypothetical protein